MKRTSLLPNLQRVPALTALLLSLGHSGFAQIMPDANGVVYVNINVNGGSSSGNSWANAVPQLADALKEAHSNANIHQIWVAKGTYAPIYSAGSDGMNPYLQFGAPDMAPFNSFLLVNNVKLYGGFQNANETNINQRDTINNNTILDGATCHHVVMSVGAVGTAEINGFTISNGHAANSQNLTVNSITTYTTRGGGIYLESSSPVISNCTITANNAEWGGGIYAGNCSLNIRNSTVNNNHAAGGPLNTSGSNAMAFGGGIYVRNGVSVSINDCNISNNTVAAIKTGVWGGGICISGYSCVATIKNSTIHNNTISANITGTGVSENGNALGGGIYLVTASTTIDNCTISNNSATLSTAAATSTGLNYDFAGGGGILNGSPLIISNSTVSNNQVIGTVNPSNNSKGWCQGGGIMNDGSLIPGNGGGIVTGSNSVVNNCIIEGNSVTGNFNPSGGGIGYNTPFLLVAPVIPKMNNSIVRNNSADKYGGGIYCYALSPVMKNTLISNNTSADGGAIYNVSWGQAAKPSLMNCTVYGNIATGSNANVITNNDSCSTTLQNGILYGNNGGIPASGIIANYSIIQGNTIFAGTGNSNANPSFYSAATGNFSLQPNSPAINAGNNAVYSSIGNITTDTDLANNQRLYGSSIDMGAYESQKDPVNPTAISPVNIALPTMTVYPNPALTGQTLTLQCNYDRGILADASLIVTDVTGKILETRQAIQPVQNITIHNTGTYLITLKLRNGEKITTSAVVK